MIMTSEDEIVQDQIWKRLLLSVRQLLAKFGKENALGDADFLLVEDNYGTLRVTVSLQNLKMLEPKIVASLRSLLADLPDWEIVMLIDVPEKKWPPMGVTIRKHIVIDGLRREILPAHFQSIQYADSRPGTGFD
jgi:hypothetical protein